jgi:hypothetical protein
MRSRSSIPEEQNAGTFEETIFGCVEEGYRIACRGDGWAQLWQPKRFNFILFFVLSLISFALLGVLYTFEYVSERELTAYIWTDADGSVHGYRYVS